MSAFEKFAQAEKTHQHRFSSPVLEHFYKYYLPDWEALPNAAAMSRAVC
jgi:hypothetical protein